MLLKIPSISSDTLLVMDKPMATIQANYNLRCKEIRERFMASLLREEQYMKLWNATADQVQEQRELLRSKDEQILLLEKKSALQSDQVTDIKKTCKKIKKRSFLKGASIGFLVGAVGTAYLIGR